MESLRSIDFHLVAYEIIEKKKKKEGMDVTHSSERSVKKKVKSNIIGILLK